MTRRGNRLTQHFSDTFHKFLDDIGKQTQALGQDNEIDVVVGVPFYDEDDTFPDVVRVARVGLQKASLSERSLILCAGSQRKKSLADVVLGEFKGIQPSPVRCILQPKEFESRRWSIRALMEACVRIKASLIMLMPDLAPQEGLADERGKGFSPHWIGRLSQPVLEHEHDLGLACFNRHPFAHSVESLLAFPIMTGIFGVRLRQSMPGIFAISHQMIHNLLKSDVTWPIEAGTYGVNAWLVIQALLGNYRICEVPLGTASFRHGVGRLKQIFRHTAHVLLEQVTENNEWWCSRNAPVVAPSMFGSRLNVPPPTYRIETRHLLRRFRTEFDHFDETLFREVLPDDLRHKIETQTDKEMDQLGISATEWIAVINRFVLVYGFETRFHPNDIVDGLFPFFLARLFGYIREVDNIATRMATATGIGSERLKTIVGREAENIVQNQADQLADSWPKFCKDWRDKSIEVSSYLPRLGSWEFVPQVGIVVPQEFENPEGGQVRANEIYKELIDRYRGEFIGFLKGRLGIEGVPDSDKVQRHVSEFMRILEKALDEELYPFDLSTVDGTRQTVQAVFDDFTEGTSFQLTPEISRTILLRVPPKNLLMQLNLDSVERLLEGMEPNDALAMAAWHDRQGYLEMILDILEDEARPDWFDSLPLKQSIVDLSLLNSDDDTRGTTALTRLAGRVIVSNYEKGGGGEYPKLWLLLTLVKRIIGVELFSEVWQKFAHDEVDFPKHLVASIRGHWGRHVLSAHNAFENKHQRILVERLKTFTSKLATSEPGKVEAAEILKAACEVYHLSITLPDATFVPLSAWTWASYSNRGGVGVPTPLSSLVERDWASRDFLTMYMNSAGLGDEEALNDTIYRLMGEGRESEDLGEILLGVAADPEQLVVRQLPDTHYKPSGALLRPVDHPILEPCCEHPWESKYVLNAAAVRLDGTIYIVYRAFGDDKISRLGLAWTSDGIHIEGRLSEPIFEPRDPVESAGCEDPRITIIEDQLYMLYTAYDNDLAQIAMASIPIQAFLEKRFDAWVRHGLGFPGLKNKDATLYPEKFDGRYVVYHRIEPNMWISYLDRLDCPWPRTGQKIVVGPRPGMMWDGVKIGAGAQPLKTKIGWLNIYHGVDYETTYRLGVLLMDLNDPSKVLYQSPNPILEPETDFELGNASEGDFWVPRVVFTCGTVPATEKDVIDMGDEILVYYGAADTVIGVAKAKLSDLIPMWQGRTGIC